MQLFVFLLFMLCPFAASQDYVDGEYFLQLAEDLIQNEAAESSFIELLQTQFGIELQKVYRFGSARLLFVRGRDADVDRAGMLDEIITVGHNMITHAAQDCDPTSSGGTWGLDRIDQTERLHYTSPTDPGATYIYGPDIGAGVRAYVLDTGIDLFHSNFENRVEWGYIADGISNPNQGDFNGHGTHVAGIIGSASYGVAKGVTLVTVRTLEDSGSGTLDELIDGLEWVYARDLNRADRSVVVIAALSSGQSPEVEIAINNLVAVGVSCVVPAGNNDLDACLYSPAYIPTAITVGSSDVDDWTSYFSNYGTCVDLYAPGRDILSTRPIESTDVGTGTSYAAAHVAGCAARYISSQATPPTPAQVHSYILTQATRDALSIYPDQDPGTPNKLLFCHCLFDMP